MDVRDYVQIAVLDSLFCSWNKKHGYTICIIPLCLWWGIHLHHFPLFVLQGYTPLHIAALHGHRHILELLIGKYGKWQGKLTHMLFVFWGVEWRVSMQQVIYYLSAIDCLFPGTCFLIVIVWHVLPFLSGAKKNLRDYSGHLACQYLNIREPTEEDRAAPEEIRECLLLSSFWLQCLWNVV